MTNTPTTTSSMQTVVLKVGLHCEGCERRVKKAIWHIKGITSVDVDNNRERITVTGFVDPSRILKAVKKTGKPVELWTYQNNGNKNLFGVPQQIATTQTRVSNGSKGNKPNKNANNKKHTDFQSSNIMLSDQDRLQHPLPDYHSEDDFEEESFPDMEFYANDSYGDFKSPKNKKNNYLDNFKSPKNQTSQFHNDFKSPKKQTSEFHNDFKSPKNQKSEFHNEFKPPKNQKKPDLYNDFKSPKNQKSEFYSDFKLPKDQQQKANTKNRSDYPSNKKTEYSQFGSDDENDFSYHNQKSDFSGGQKSKGSPYTGYGNHKDGSQPEYEFKKSGSNFSEQGKSQYLPPGFENEEKTYNQKKQKHQVAPKYVSFEDDYQPKYRPQSESNHRVEDRGYEQKFFASQGHEQSYHPSYSYTYHDNNRVPANGFTNIFSEENPNACSIM